MLKDDSLTPFLTHLQSLDIRLWMDGDTLRCNAPKGALTPELTAQLKEHKLAIIALLKGSPARPDSSEPNSTSTETPSTQQLDWQQDILLPENISPPLFEKGKALHPHSSRRAKPYTPTLREGQSPTSPHPKNILLTGATGFLGAFLLYELLQQTEAKIHCLVRETTLAMGSARVKQCLSNYNIWHPSFVSRLVPVLGDLTQPWLGLSDKQFYALAEQVDSIYHNGAQVHHISPYSQLKAANVDGTREILKLACHGRPKPLHYTSTLSVLPPRPLPGHTKIYEQDDLSTYPVPAGGYNRSKWAAEQLVAQARDRNLPITIYRPGPISGHSQTGIFNPNDFLYRLMQGYIQSGMAPDGEMPLDILPVDYVSKAMVYLSLQPTSFGKAFHLIHPHPASSNLLFDACRAAGYPVQRVPYETWFQKLMHIAQGDKHHALYPLVALFSSRQGTPDTQQTMTELPEIPFDTQQTMTTLQDAPFDLPLLNPHLFETYLKAMLP
ncbi:MAG: thioester reductase domain-containing protein [Cyanobacteria bacterium P01_F01_bin.4]